MKFAGLSLIIFVATIFLVAVSKWNMQTNENSKNFNFIFFDRMAINQSISKFIRLSLTLFLCRFGFTETQLSRDEIMCGSHP